jgi:DNA-binding PadR family transcriptional regulator
MESTVAITRDWEVCGTCHELRGRFASRVRGVVERHVQECRCQREAHERAETWTGFDFNQRAELCSVCGCEVLRSGSRSSTWLCSVCKARVLELRARTGRTVVPTGRYFVLPVTPQRSDAEAEVIADRLFAMGRRMNRLADYRKSIYQNPTMAHGEKPLPAASLHVVLALLDGELHGYGLMRRVEDLSDGSVRMGPGTLYGTLNRLVDDGLIVETTGRVARSDDERRRYYELTPAGRTKALAELERLQRLVKHVRRGVAGAAGA